jgi:hypothetical protein
MHRASRWSSAVIAIAAALTLFAPHARSVAAPSPYHVVARWVIGGEGGWDYLTADTLGRRLYVSHGRRVDVLNLDTGAVIDSIGGTLGVHGIAIASDLGHGYVSCGRDSSVTAFDLKTLKTVARFAVPARNPDAILYEPVTHRVFTFNGGSANATAFNAGTGVLEGTLDLGGKPEFPAADGKGRVYVNIEDKSEIVAFDARTLKIEARWPIAPGAEPSGLALDRAHGMLFSGCSNKTLVVADTKDGHVVTTLPIGEGVDAVGFDGTRELVFSSNGEGTLTVAHREADGSYKVAETDSTQRGARTMALDERTGRVFVVTASFGPPPPPTEDRPHPRASIVPGTFVVLVLSR